MDEKRYHAIADATLMHCLDQLEPLFEKGQLADLDLENGMLTLRTETGQTYLLSKHAPSLQLWLASPVSGGLHFSYNDATQHWHLPDGRTLYALLCHELKDASIEVSL